MLQQTVDRQHVTTVLPFNCDRIVTVTASPTRIPAPPRTRTRGDVDIDITWEKSNYRPPPPSLSTGTPVGVPFFKFSNGCLFREKIT